jgi:hypothetical protein
MTLRPTLAALLLLATTLLPARAATPTATLAAAVPSGACQLAWQITPQLASSPRQLRVALRLDSGGRRRTLLRLPAGWQGVADDEGSDAASQPVADDPALRSVDHAASGPLTLRFRLTPGPASDGLRLGPDWLMLAGQAALPMPEGLPGAEALTLCVTIDGLPEASRYLGSHGSGSGPQMQWRFTGGLAQAQLALYAGGALQVVNRNAEGQPLTLALPAASSTTAEPPVIDAVAQAATQQRRFWRDADAAPLAVLLLPAPARSAPEGTALGNALWLQVPDDLRLPSSALDAAVTEALLRQRLPVRLGPLVHAGRSDEALRAWLGEGLVAFYTHRLLLRSGAWTPEDYAAELNRRIARYLASPVLAADNLKVATGWMTDPGLADLPAARGEWLALQWHAALRAAGQPGLDGVLRKLMLPAAQARREGPLSAPLATHRLLAALRHTLDDAPLRDLTEHIDRGVPFGFAAGSLGPCFRLASVRLPEWRLGFDRNALATGVVSGVEPGGPAEAAGLRDGMAIRSHRVVHGDVEQPVWLQVAAADGTLQTISYTAAGTRQRELPRYQPVAQALQQPACQGWLGLGPEAEAVIASARGPRRAVADDDGDAGAAVAPCRPARVAKASRGKTGKAAKAAKAKPSAHCSSGAKGKAGKGGKAGAHSGKGGKASAKAGKSGGKSTKATGGAGKAKKKIRH